MKKTMKSVGSKATGFCITVGKAVVQTKGPVTKSTLKNIKTLITTLDDVNPDGDALTFGVGRSGIHGSIGKRITPIRIALVAASFAVVWYGSKFFYKFIEKKFIGTPKTNETENSLSAYLVPLDKTPTSHTLNELANTAGIELCPLFDIYLYTGDVCIFFSTANLGKTVVAIQMAIEIATGKWILFPDGKNHSKQNVVYLNFEMKASQMKKRLTSQDGRSIKFPNNIDMRDCMGCFKDVDEFLVYIAKIAETELLSDTVIFIDTITDICPQFFSKEAYKVLNALRTIQVHAFQLKNITLTFVIEGHASKKHDWDPLELENLKGGVNQANLADSIFGLGPGVEKTRYLKILKARNDERPETVDVLKISQKDYVLPENIGKAKEEDILIPKKNGTKKGLAGVTPLHSNPSTDSHKPEWKGKLSLEKAKEMKAFYRKGEPGHGYPACAEKFGLNHAVEAQREIEALDKYLKAIGE